MSPYSLPGFSHRLPCRGPDPPAPPRLASLALGRPGRGAPSLPVGPRWLNELPLPCSTIQISAASFHRYRPPSDPIRVDLEPRVRSMQCFLSFFILINFAQVPSTTRFKNINPPFFGALPPIPSLPSFPLAHCLRELTGEIRRCLGGGAGVSAPPVAYWGFSVLSHSRLSSIPEPGGSCQMPQSFSH